MLVYELDQKCFVFAELIPTFCILELTEFNIVRCERK